LLLPFSAQAADNFLAAVDSTQVPNASTSSIGTPVRQNRITGYWAGCSKRCAADARSVGKPVRDKPTAPASPWQNGFAERLIGSIRRECVDHFVVLGEAHLRRMLRDYARYYNGIRTHRSLDKDAPITRPVQRIGIVQSHAILGGLHHHYVRV
jgi:transposase InsO family protein